MTAPQIIPQITPLITPAPFRYESWQLDPERGLLSCRYSLGDRQFEEKVTFDPGGRWDDPAAGQAARLVFLLAGVSYYKTAAPPVIDLGTTAVTDTERRFLRSFYLDGLGEFAYRNGLDLSGLRIEGPSRPEPEPPAGRAADPRAAAPTRPLVPFGGGIDSIVTVEHVRHRADAALFIMSRPGSRFEAIEAPAAVTGLPIVRAGREIDPQLLRSAELGFLNGHVPVTGILSAIAVMAAVLAGRDAVVMSNEWSASIPTLEADGRPVNHQFSKSMTFEGAFREVLATALGGGETAGSAEAGGQRDQLLLLPAPVQRAVGRAAVRRADRVPRHVPQLQPGLPPGRVQAARPLVRPLRQVLLHRPDPGPVPARRGAQRHLRRPGAAGRPRPGAVPGPEVPRAAGHAARQQAVRVRRRDRRVPGRRAARRAAARPGRHPAAPGTGGRGGPDPRPARRGQAAAAHERSLHPG